eukprot:TRINITY_DN343_c0_g3_i1.p1 TRINITY_DN343_c0_g3~~TRINITY_DN343_c0_g3_i1.p1  ORF type:complete len:3335 (+),score=792.62 TRINITY_DN343_c0_g3_i1:472-10005(+)
MANLTDMDGDVDTLVEAVDISALLKALKIGIMDALRALCKQLCGVMKQLEKLCKAMLEAFLSNWLQSLPPQISEVVTGADVTQLVQGLSIEKIVDALKDSAWKAFKELGEQIVKVGAQAEKICKGMLQGWLSQVTKIELDKIVKILEPLRIVAILEELPKGIFSALVRLKDQLLAVVENAADELNEVCRSSAKKALLAWLSMANLTDMDGDVDTLVEAVDISALLKALKIGIMDALRALCKQLCGVMKQLEKLCKALLEELLWGWLQSLPAEVSSVVKSEDVKELLQSLTLETIFKALKDSAWDALKVLGKQLVAAGKKLEKILKQVLTGWLWQLFQMLNSMVQVEVTMEELDGILESFSPIAVLEGLEEGVLSALRSLRDQLLEVSKKLIVKCEQCLKSLLVRYMFLVLPVDLKTLKKCVETLLDKIRLYEVIEEWKKNGAMSALKKLGRFLLEAWDAAADQLNELCRALMKSGLLMAVEALKIPGVQPESLDDLVKDVDIKALLKELSKNIVSMLKEIGRQMKLMAQQLIVTLDNIVKQLVKGLIGELLSKLPANCPLQVTEEDLDKVLSPIKIGKCLVALADSPVDALKTFVTECADAIKQLTETFARFLKAILAGVLADLLPQDKQSKAHWQSYSKMIGSIALENLLENLPKGKVELGVNKFTVHTLVDLLGVFLDEGAQRSLEDGVEIVKKIPVLGALVDDTEFDCVMIIDDEQKKFRLKDVKVRILDIVTLPLEPQKWKDGFETELKDMSPAGALEKLGKLLGSDVAETLKKVMQTLEGVPALSSLLKHLMFHVKVRIGGEKKEFTVHELRMNLAELTLEYDKKKDLVIVSLGAEGVSLDRAVQICSGDFFGGVGGDAKGSVVAGNKATSSGVACVQGILSIKDLYFNLRIVGQNKRFDLEYVNIRTKFDAAFLGLDGAEIEGRYMRGKAGKTENTFFIAARIKNWELTSLARITSGVNGPGEDNELMKMIGKVELSNLALYLILAPAKARAIALYTTLKVGDHAANLYFSYDAATKACIFVVAPASGDGLPLHAMLGGILPPVKTLFEVVGIEIWLHYVLFTHNWKKETAICDEDVKKDIEIIHKSGTEALTTVSNKMKKWDIKPSSTMFAMSATIKTTDKGLWSYLGLGGWGLTGTVIFASAADPVVEVELFEGKIVTLPCRGIVEVTTSKVEGKLSVDLPDRNKVIRATFACALTFDHSKNEVSASLSLDGADNSAINLGHWVDCLDWVEIYGISAKIACKPGAMYGEFGGGFRVVLDKTARSNRPDATMEVFFRYDPTCVKTKGVSVAYLYMDNMTIMTLLRGFFRLPRIQALEWVESFLCPMRTVGFLFKFDGKPLDHLPCTKLRPEDRDERNMICKFLTERNVLPATGKTIYAFQCRWKFLFLDLTVFGAVVMDDVIPLEPSGIVDKVKNAAIDSVKKSLKNKSAEDVSFGVQAEFIAELQPIDVKIGGFQILKISGFDPDKPNDANLPATLIVRVGGSEMYFKFSAQVVVFPSWLGVSVKAFVEFKKGEGFAPRLIVHLEFELLGAVKFIGTFRLTMQKLAPGARAALEKVKDIPALGGVAGMASQALDMIMIPKEVKARLSVESMMPGKDIIGALLTAIREACTNFSKTIREGLEKAQEKLSKAENIPIIGWFATMLKWLLKAAQFLVSCLEKGINFVVGMIEKLVTSVLQIHKISVGGGIGGDEGLSVNVYLHIVIFGMTVKGGLDINLKKILQDIGKWLMGLICGKKGVSSKALDSGGIDPTNMGEYADEKSNDDDSDEEGNPRVKREPGSVDGNPNIDETKFPKMSAEEMKEMKDTLDKIKSLMHKVEGQLVKKIEDGDVIEPSPLPTPENLRKFEGQYENLFTGTEPPKPDEKLCPFCNGGVPAKDIPKHMQFDCHAVKSQKAPCQYCGTDFPFLDLGGHEAFCPQRPREPRQCTSDGCNVKDLFNCEGEKCAQCKASGGSGKCIKYHLRHECLGKVLCWKCDQKVASKDYRQHTCTDKNGKEWQTCEKCESMVLKEEMPAHRQECKTSKCECGKFIQQAELDDHKKNYCPKRIIKCAGEKKRDELLQVGDPDWELACGSGCGAALKHEDLEEHLKKECPSIGIKCLKCARNVPPIHPHVTPPQRQVSHLQAACPARKKDCPLDCGLQMVPSDIPNHVRNDCPKKDTKCYWLCCNRTLEDYEANEADLRACGECGKDCVDTSSVMEHLAGECDLFKPQCPMGCGKNIAYKNYAAHWRLKDEGSPEIERCTTFYIPCPSGANCKDAAFCNADTPCNAICREMGHHVAKLRLKTADGSTKPFEDHVQACVKLPCPFSGGDCQTGTERGIVYGELNTHVRECQHIKAKCVFGCGEELAINNPVVEAVHVVSKCDKFKMGCTKCNKLMPYKDISAHLARDCPKNEVNCVMCSVKVPKKDMAHHLENDCSQFMLKCQWKPDVFSAGSSTDFRPRPPACCTPYRKCEEARHVTRHHIAMPDEDVPNSVVETCREGLARGNDIARLTTWPLSMMAGSDPRLRQLAHVDFAEERCQMVNLDVDMFRCEYCQEPVQEGDYGTHLRDECPLYTEKCPECQKADIPVSKMATHLIEECEKAEKRCKRCFQTILRKKESEHLAYDCTAGTVFQCHLCYETMQEEDFEPHLVQGQCRAMQEVTTCCDHGIFFRGKAAGGCNAVVKKGDLLKHWMTECEAHKVSCPLCEKPDIPKKDVMAHMLECPKFVMKCVFCDTTVPGTKTGPGRTDWSLAMIEHMFQDCGRFEIQCGWCADPVKWTDVPSHLASAKQSDGQQPCQGFLALCPYNCKSLPSKRQVSRQQEAATPDAAKDTKEELIDWPSLPQHMITGRKETKKAGTRQARRGISLCENYEVRCPYEACDDKCKFPNDLPEAFQVDRPADGRPRMKRSRLPHHIWHECAGNVRKCKNHGLGCPEEVSARDWEKHDEECQFKPVPCPKCKVKMERSKIDEHMKTDCVDNPVTCPFMGCDYECVSVLMDGHKLTCQYREVYAHEGTVDKRHGEPTSPPHEWKPFHLPRKEHSGDLYKRVSQTLGNIFSLGISAAFESGRILFYDCCEADENQPGEKCSKPRFKCGSCDRTLKSMTDMSNGCRKKCLMCGADELSSDSSVDSSLCQAVCERCKFSMNLFPECLKPVCTSCSGPIEKGTACGKTLISISNVNPEVRRLGGFRDAS